MVYIRSTGNISPYPAIQRGNRLRCVEPDYAAVIDPKMLRRMSRVIRMGVAAAIRCLQGAGAPDADGVSAQPQADPAAPGTDGRSAQARRFAPDAIVTGTAYGCLEDTIVFLTKMVDNQEEMLTPTAFIQSTHNTVGAQIALMLKCHAYNNTFVHRGFSFESAVLDATMLLAEGKAGSVLVGGLDEITDASHALLTRFGLYKREDISNPDLFTAGTRGTINGEGAAFFLLSNEPGPVRLDALETFYKPASAKASATHIISFLERQGLTPADIDLVLTGRNGNVSEDVLYEQIGALAFPGRPLEHFKHLCGEYPTATAFALWLASEKLKGGGAQAAGGSALTAAGRPAPGGEGLRRILIYNHYQNIHHSLYLVSAC